MSCQKITDLAKELVEAVTHDDSGSNGTGGNGGLLSRDTIHKAGLLRAAMSQKEEEETIKLDKPVTLVDPDGNKYHVRSGIKGIVVSLQIVPLVVMGQASNSISLIPKKDVFKDG